MFFITYGTLVLSYLLIFCREAELLPSWTGEPSNPWSVAEGESTTLLWNYTLDGTFRVGTFSDRRAGDAGPVNIIAEKLLTSDPVITSDYQARFQVNISDTQASMRILAVQRSDSGLYRYAVTNKNLKTIESNVDILVHYVPEKTNLSSNATDGKVCLDAVEQFTCVSDASPPVHSYLLYKDNVVVDNSSSGVWSINMTAGGNSSFKCQANNTLGSGVSDSISLLVNVPPVISPLNNQTVEEGDTVTLNCDAPGSPDPTVNWTNVSSSDRRNGKTWIITNISRADAGEYRCDASNECGNRTRSTFITVNYAPSILDISANKSVDENDGANLTCTADGIPVPDITWTRVSDNSPVSFNFTITGKQDEGIYRCTAVNVVRSISKNVSITVENYHPFGTQLHTSLQNDIVELNVMFNVTCSAEAMPLANHRFYMGGESVFNDTSGAGVFPTHVSNRVEQVKYGCIPNNSYGDGPEKTIDVTVHYPARVTGITITPRGELVDEGRNVSITCTVEGNPKPSLTWTKDGSDKMFEESDTIDFAPASRNDTGTYNCTASNGVGAASSANISFKVQPHVCQNCSGSMKLRDVVYNENLNNMESEDSRNLAKTIEKGMEKAMNGTEYNRTSIDEYGRGSVVVFFTLIFNQPIDGEIMISLLKSATSRGDFGDLGVDATSIMLIQATVPPSTTTRPPTPSPSPSGNNDCSSTFYTEDCEWKHLWTIIFVVLVVVVVLIVGVVVWRVLKRRKCRRKSPKVANTCTGEEGHVLQEFPDGAYAQVNQSYAKSGPAPANEYDQGAAGASAVPPVTYAVVDKSKKNEKPPDYAVVDKSKKKKKSGANKEKPPEDQYAVVLKSQKKKNPEEPVQQYAQVDRSMKKKHAKPGEVLYADLGEFHGNNSLPKVATSPELLPPIKKPPPAYVETQYADITQFLKGDATLPPSDGTGGVTSAAATPPGEEAGGGSSHVSKL